MSRLRQGQSAGGDGRGLSTAKNPEGVRAEASTLSGFSTKLELLPRKVGLPVWSSSGLSTTRGPSQGCPRVGIRDRKSSNPYRQAFWQRDYRDLVEPFAKQQTVGNDEHKTRHISWSGPNSPRFKSPSWRRPASTCSCAPSRVIPGRRRWELLWSKANPSKRVP